MMATNSSVSIVIPFKNEAHCMVEYLNKNLFMLKKNLALNGEIIWINDNSTDDSFNVLLNWLSENEFPTNKIFRGLGQGVGNAFWLGVKQSKLEKVILLPVDCILSFESLQQVVKTDNAFFFGAFQKEYNPKTLLLSLYSTMQNIFLLKIFKVIAWTNVFVFSREALVSEPDIFTGFLDDLNLGKFYQKISLKEERDFTVFSSFVTVSSRRYLAGAVHNRIMINAVVLSLWIFKFKNSCSIRKFYHEPTRMSFVNIFKGNNELYK